MLVYTVAFVAVAELLVVTSASAKVAHDITTISASPIDEEQPRTVVPAYPSLFVHFGHDGRRMVPTFSTPDGTSIAIRDMVEISKSPNELMRFDLDIVEGEVFVRFREDELPVAHYTVDPLYRPRTRSVTLRPTGTLSVDSDAVELEIYGRGTYAVVPNGGTADLELGKQQRVIALYSNGTTEEIYDDVPRAAPREKPDHLTLKPVSPMDLSPVPATILLLLVLGAIGGLAARTE